MTPPSLAAFDLPGKLAVVTGARSGIGLAIAEAMAAAGADIVAVSAHLEPSGSQVEARIAAHGRTCLSLAADFADRAAVRELASALADLGRPVDILVNNAGTIARAPAAEHSDTDWDRVISVDRSEEHT